jgi:hypothetical protein
MTVRALAVVLSISAAAACVAWPWIGRHSAVYVGETCALVGLGLLLVRAGLTGGTGPERDS